MACRESWREVLTSRGLVRFACDPCVYEPYRRRWGYLYVRIPAKLKALFEPIWLAGYPIPVIISIPPIPTTPLKDGVRPLGETPRAPGSNKQGRLGGAGRPSPAIRSGGVRT